VIAGKKYAIFSTLFLDKETDTYSLSRFQFFIWTFVGILSYLYFLLSRSLVQGRLEFVDVPSGLPAIILISASTTALAQGITSSKGSKGAGEIHPSPSDFISVGGVVAPERFQFFIWTILGAVVFVFLVFLNDPGTIKDLPTVPSGFLQLMGVSSFGYLGGKLARKAGPVIKLLSVTSVTPKAVGPPPAPAVLTLNLKGENLDPTGSITIDNKPLRGDLFPITGDADPQTGFSTELNVTLKDATDYLEGSHNLTLVNKDGQAATVAFPIDPMGINSVADIPLAPPGTVDLEVTGKNFVPGILAEWTLPGGQNLPDPPADQGPYFVVDCESGTKLKVNRVPKGTQGGKGKLTLISPTRLRASQIVNITGP
jgi:hypothetical protein